MNTFANEISTTVTVSEWMVVEDPDPLECTDCGWWFSSETSLEWHRQPHTNYHKNRCPYRCNQLKCCQYCTSSYLTNWGLHKHMVQQHRTQLQDFYRKKKPHATDRR